MLGEFREWGTFRPTTSAGPTASARPTIRVFGRLTIGLTLQHQEHYHDHDRTYCPGD